METYTKLELLGEGSYAMVYKGKSKLVSVDFFFNMIKCLYNVIVIILSNVSAEVVQT